MKSIPTFDIENEVIAARRITRVSDTYLGFEPRLFIAGLDEAGRGPLCGPVVAAAVIFNRISDTDFGFEFSPYPKSVSEIRPHLITDSKQMTPRQRERAYEWLTNNPDIIWAVAQASAAEIDEINILQASLLAMRRAVDALADRNGNVIRPDFVLVDGNRLPDSVQSSEFKVRDYTENRTLNSEHYNGRAVVKGDSKSISIAAASIIAKETRDKIMKNLAAEHPEYGWDRNMGYPTAEHLRAIEKYGITPHHRKSFAPIRKLVMNDEL
ncbi:ribonuclease HII [Bacteroidia bacterium]|nr:ribonuclease HII [Bacteroidia bacterium]